MTRNLNVAQADSGGVTRDSVAEVTVSSPAEAPSRRAARAPPVARPRRTPGPAGRQGLAFQAIPFVDKQRILLLRILFQANGVAFKLPGT
jgi:hypothetical protein